jgi:hypothetical protein
MRGHTMQLTNHRRFGEIAELSFQLNSTPLHNSMIYVYGI